MARPVVATYSIAACDLDAGQWGVATQSKFLGVGSVVPWAEPGIGAIATQAYANPRYGPEGLVLLREGKSAEQVIELLTAADEGRDHRQLGVVDGEGRGASYTGSECLDWAGGRTGPCYAAQGNILVSAATVDAIAETFEAGDRPVRRAAARLPRRCPGGRGRQPRPAVGGDPGRRAGRRLRRPFRQHRRPARRRAPEAARGAPPHLRHAPGDLREDPAEKWLDVDEELAAELGDRLARVGYEGELGEAFFRWSANENLEERVDGIERVDPVVLEELRRQS